MPSCPHSQLACTNNFLRQLMSSQLNICHFLAFFIQSGFPRENHLAPVAPRGGNQSMNKGLILTTHQDTRMKNWRTEDNNYLFVSRPRKKKKSRLGSHNHNQDENIKPLQCLTRNCEPEPEPQAHQSRCRINKYSILRFGNNLTVGNNPFQLFRLNTCHSKSTHDTSWNLRFH